MKCVGAIKEVRSLLRIKQRQRVILLIVWRKYGFRKVAEFGVGINFDMERDGGEDFP